MQVNPSLKIWGSAWSPPAWLKQNNDYAGGENSMRFEPRELETYARYLAKYVEAYQATGIPVYAIHVQNEPASMQVFPSCHWTGAQIRDFVRDYLGPRFHERQVKAEIWLGTINDGDIDNYAVPVLSDPDAAAYIAGVGYQWAGKDAVGPTHELYPGYPLMQTETECGGGENNWNSAAYTWSLMKHYLSHGTNSYMYWNMVLDQKSVSTWGWGQNAMVTINTDTRTVTYNPEFYLMKHFGAFIAPGATRISAMGNDDVLAFRNPDGAIVVVASNRDDDALRVTLRTMGKRLSASLPAQSFNTFVLS
jgi:glucosylceramidase